MAALWVLKRDIIGCVSDCSAPAGPKFSTEFSRVRPGDSLEDLDQRIQGDLLGTKAGFGPGVDRLSVALGEIVADRLALMAEAVAGETEEGVRVGQGGGGGV